MMTRLLRFAAFFQDWNPSSAMNYMVRFVPVP